MNLRKTVSSAGLKALRSAGFFYLAANSAARRKRLLILCYHGLSIDDEHLWLPNLYMPAEQFRQRLQFLKDMGVVVLPLEEAVCRLHTESLPARSVVLTFDDGFVDFYRYALPILSEFSYPCTLYLTTHYCEYRLPIITLVLDYILWKSGLSDVELPDWGIAGPKSIRSYPERQQVVKTVLAVMRTRSLSTDEKNQVAEEIARRINVNYDRLIQKRMLQIISKDEASQTARAGIDLQLHTHRHRTPIDRDLFRREILDNSDAISDICGQRPLHFCYPSGRHVPEFVPWLQELGVKSATTCETGLADRHSADLTLPRVLDDSTMEAVRFQSFVAGLFT